MFTWALDQFQSKILLHVIILMRCDFKFIQWKESPFFFKLFFLNTKSPVILNNILHSTVEEYLGCFRHQKNNLYIVWMTSQIETSDKKCLKIINVMIYVLERESCVEYKVDWIAVLTCMVKGKTWTCNNKILNYHI